MKPNKNFIVILVLSLEICFASINVKTTAIDSTGLIDATVDILTRCYEEDGPIGIAGRLPQTFLTKLWSKKDTPVILIDRHQKMYEKVWDTPRPRLPVFLIIASSLPTFYYAYRDMRISQLYDYKAPILVLYLNAKLKTRGCEDAKLPLTTLKVNAISNVAFLCIDADEKLSILSLNPYKNYAPQPWQFIGYEALDDDEYYGYFAFSRRYEGNNNTCVNLKYDRTKDMAGATILLYSTSYEPWDDRLNYTIENRMMLEISTFINIWQTFFRQLNATPMQRYVTGPGTVDGEGIEGVSFEPTALRDQPPYCFIILPVLQSKMRILTQYRGNKSQISKILTVIDTYSRYCVGVVFLITLLFFKFVAHQQFVPGMLNVIRMTCNTGFTNLPENIKSRTYLAGLFLFVVTMHGIFAGNLSSLLTTDIPLRHARTITDLIELNYTIYVEYSLFVFLQNTYPETRLGLIRNGLGCKIVLTDPLAACITNANWVIEYGKKYKMYVSDDQFVTYHTFSTILESPYLDAMNQIFLRLFEGAIMAPLESRVIDIRNKEYQSDMQNRQLPPKSMTLYNLNFSFVMLAIGLVCATVSFIVEISFNPLRSRIAKVGKFLKR